MSYVNIKKKLSHNCHVTHIIFGGCQWFSIWLLGIKLGKIFRMLVTVFMLHICDPINTGAWNVVYVKAQVILVCRQGWESQS